MNQHQNQKKFSWFGWVGLLVILAAELSLLANVQFVKNFFTPTVWTGYILFVDALLKKIVGKSYLLNRRKEFLFMLLMSLICWLIFEAYNLHLKNWIYINLPEHLAARLLGYVWSFVTIFPGVLLTSEVIDGLKIFDRWKVRRFVISKNVLFFWIAMGALLLIIPLILPGFYARYLFGLVWVGFVFLLDPINALFGERSLFVDLREGKINKLFSLFLSGIICGFLWEFWNYWANTKWIYTLPFLQTPKIFEMPLAGFFGFLPFAVECYVMWLFVRHVFQKYFKVKLG